MFSDGIGIGYNISLRKKIIVEILEMIDKPTNAIFCPTLIEVKFKTKFKVQLAFYRLAKVSKTDPLQFSDPKQPVVLTNQLKLSTTLPYDSERNQYSDKEVDIQMAYEIQLDARTKEKFKELLNCKINLKDYIGRGDTNHRLVLKQEPLIALNFKLQLVIKDQLLKERVNEIKMQPADQGRQVGEKPKRKIRFEQENTKNQENRQDSSDKKRLRSLNNRKNQTNYPKSETKLDKNQYKSSSNCDIDYRGLKEKKFQQKSLGNIADKKQDQLVCGRSSGSNSPTQKACVSNDRQKKEIKRLNQMLRQQNTAVQDLQSQKKLLIMRNKEIEKRLAQFKEMNSSLKTNEAKLNQSELRLRQCEAKLAGEAKTMKSFRDQLVRQAKLKKSIEQQLTQCRQESIGYRATIQNLSKALTANTESCKNISMNQNEAKYLKDRLKQAEKQISQLKREYQSLQQQSKDKDEIVIRDLKNKIYQLDKELLEVTSQNKHLAQKIERIKQEYKQQIEELNKTIQQLTNQLKTAKSPKAATQKEIGLENAHQLKRKIEELERQLSKKEEMIQKVMLFQKQSQSQKNQETSLLRKQVLELRETIQKLESDKAGEPNNLVSLEFKVQTERMKKQLQTVKKNQKSLLIEKANIQKLYSLLQVDIVKSKESIAGILNLVQDSGNQKLIGDVYTLIE